MWRCVCKHGIKRHVTVFLAQKADSARFESYKIMASTSKETKNIEMTEG